MLHSRLALFVAAISLSVLPSNAGTKQIADQNLVSPLAFPDATPNGWQWVPLEGSSCIGGEQTGVYVKHGSSKNLGVYLAGGGACFNSFTCLTCTTSPKPGTPKSSGIFSATDARNPFRDYSWIYVPYCTGDVHLGAIKHKYYGAERHFSGRKNLQLMAEKATATFRNVGTLVVTGESAGGFGAAANYDFLRSSIKAQRGVMIDDSGPILDDKSISPCLQERWRKGWNINATLPPGCPCIGDKGNIVAAWKFVMGKYPKDGFGLISSLNDAVISSFFSFGLLGCNDPFPVAYNRLEGGLKRLSALGVPVYMIEGNVHTHTGGKNSFYTKSSAGTLLYKWVAQLESAKLPNPGSVVPKKGNSNVTVAYA